MMNEPFSLRDWAWYAGEARPDREWLLHDADVWVANPHYKGEPGPHIEDDVDLHARCSAQGCEINDSDCLEYHVEQEAIHIQDGCHDKDCEVCGGRLGMYDHPVYVEGLPGMIDYKAYMASALPF